MRDSKHSIGKCCKVNGNGRLFLPFCYTKVKSGQALGIQLWYELKSDTFLHEYICTLEWEVLLKRQEWQIISAILLH